MARQCTKKNSDTIGKQLISALVEELKCFESVSKKLKTGSPSQMDIYDSKVSLEELVRDFGEKYPLTSLRPNSNIINDPDFENTIAKIQGGSEGLINNREKRACAHFLRDGAPNSILNTLDQELGYADRVLLADQQEKRARLEKSKCRCAKHVTSQNNICKRLFSQAK